MLAVGGWFRRIRFSLCVRRPPGNRATPIDVIPVSTCNAFWEPRLTCGQDERTLQSETRSRQVAHRIRLRSGHHLRRGVALGVQGLRASPTRNHPQGFWRGTAATPWKPCQADQRDEHFRRQRVSPRLKSGAERSFEVVSAGRAEIFALPGFCFPRLRFPKRHQNQQTRSDADTAVCDVEGRPRIALDIEIEKIDDGPFQEPVQ
jgi:hypothetical protein